MRIKAALVAVVLMLVGVLFTQGREVQAQGQAQAAGGAALSMAITNQANASGAAYWTPERMANAQPMRVYTSSFAGQSEVDQQVSGSPVSGNGRRPTATAGASAARQFYDPAAVNIEAEFDSGAVEPDNFGLSGGRFSSSRVNPISSDRAYPFLTVGKLFFTQPGVGDFVCSASVLRPRVLVTAGHCVHRGSGGQAGFFTNWSFVPALRNGAGPLGSWTPAFVIVTGTWAGGGGGVPNAADYAMMQMNDRVFSGVTRRIADLTGFLGFQTLNLNNQHVAMLGYPCNLDSCQQMHEVHSQSFRTRSPNSVDYGSDMRGGSSGGPWVKNWGVTAAGSPAGLDGGRNRIVGITSYGPNATDQLFQGSSIPDSRFSGLSTSLLNILCARRAGNC